MANHPKVLAVVVALVASCAVSLVAPAVVEAAPDPYGTTFVPVTPCRLLDTRQSGGPIEPGGARLVQVTDGGACHVPEDAFAIEATFTAVAPIGSGFLRAYQPGVASPSGTFLNYAGDEDTSNTGAVSITPGPAPTRGLAVRTYGSATDVVIDVQGYFRRPQAPSEGALFVAATPCRAYDSRSTGSRRPLADRERRDLDLVDRTSCRVPADAVAVEATVTAADSPGPGFLRAWPSDRGAPNATFLTHVGGRSTTNTGAITIRSGAGHSNLSVRNYGTPTHLVVEVQGWFVPAPAPPAATFRPRQPCRIFDTRRSGGPIAPRAQRSVQVTNVTNCNVPDDAVAVEATITAIDPSGSGFLRVGPAGEPTPQATFLTFPRNRSTTNTGAIALRPGAAPNLVLRNYGSAADYVVDVQGWYIATQ